MNLHDLEAATGRSRHSRSWRYHYARYMGFSSAESSILANRSQRTIIQLAIERWGDATVRDRIEQLPEDVIAGGAWVEPDSREIIALKERRRHIDLASGND